MRPEAMVSMCKKTCGPMNRRRFDKVAFGVGRNAHSKGIGKFRIPESGCRRQIMSENRTIHLFDIPMGGQAGFVWNRLHGEREDLCEALLQDPGLFLDERRELLQSRLVKIDDALDRLMSGSYGNCCKCGRWIEDTKLDFDPAVAFCIECWQREQSQKGTRSLIAEKHEPEEIASSDLSDNVTGIDQQSPGVVLEMLAPFDTIWVQTLYSHYRILLLEPRSGRALVEGGAFVEPAESVVVGSTFGRFTPRVGWIGIGWRVEMWV